MCRLQITLSCAVLCHIVLLQYLSRSSIHRLDGLSCRLFLSYGLQVVTREVHWSSLRRWICPAQDHFIVLIVLIISMIFVLSQSQMLVFLSLYTAGSCGGPMGPDRSNRSSPFFYNLLHDAHLPILSLSGVRRARGRSS